MDKNTPVRTPCAKEGCSNKKCEENAYCLKHQRCVFVDETKSLGKKVCKNYIRGCSAQLDLDFSYSGCDKCREEKRLREQAKREATAAIAAQVADDASEKPCTTCFKVLPMDMFRGKKGGTTKQCQVCRDDNKKQDELRDREHRNALARVAESQPVRRERKREARKRKAPEEEINTL